VQPARAPHPLASLFIGTALLSGVGLFGKSVLIAHLLHAPLWLVTLLLAVALCLPLASPLAMRFRRILAPLVVMALLFASLFVFPRMEALHSTGRGTDQPDCVIVAARHVMSGTWPYDRAQMWSGNPMSCGPAWVAIQSPSIALMSYSGNLVTFWAVCLGLLTLSIGWSATAACLSLLCLSPGFWLAACNGSDFLTFGIATAALFATLRRFRSKPAARVALAIAAAALGQFRAATLLLPAFLTGWLGRRTAFLSGLLSLCVEAGYIVWNASSFVADGPLHIAVKLTNHQLFSKQPFLTSIELTLPVLAVAGLVILLPKLHGRAGLLTYFSVIFILPSLLDFTKKKQMYGTYINMLQYWEGALWLCACLPLFALLFVDRSGRILEPPHGASATPAVE
jgi:hypothetical protein